MVVRSFTVLCCKKKRSREIPIVERKKTGTTITDNNSLTITTEEEKNKGNITSISKPRGAKSIKRINLIQSLSNRLVLLLPHFSIFTAEETKKRKEGKLIPPPTSLCSSNDKNGEGVPYKQKKESEWLVLLDLPSTITLNPLTNSAQSTYLYQRRIQDTEERWGSFIQSKGNNV